MVVFNECRIDPEGKYLIVEASVDSMDYYEDVYINSIVIDTNTTYSANGPSEKHIYSKEFDNKSPERVYSKDDYIPIHDNEILEIYSDELNLTKRIRLKLSAKDLGVSLNDNIFFIYVGTGGIPKADTPCGMDQQYSMYIAFNMRPLYNMTMGYIREMENNCEPPKGFIDKILRLKAFELSLKTGNYPVAFKQWEKLKSEAPIISKKNCGCHGIY